MSVSYFWGASDPPFDSGRPQGLSIGYSFGGEFSATISTLSYTFLGRLP